ncbi:hypothetical protein EVAR_250_1 [Eumeta japonica]|uniref:Uncharacterized protein n=1 Tax=Eumeta variegata TaxID=151549 RepID=A0A4C1S984_EUMVA|nr:hypothetical protein EVAR_250_1 [Eumeta japonica]
MCSSTRKKDEIFLLGVRGVDPLLRLNQLPTLRQVLLRYHYILNEFKNMKDSAHALIQELIEVWSKSSIPTEQQNHCIEKLIKCHKNWLLLKKNRGRNSEAQRKRENLFTNELDKLFDISHASAMNVIKIAEDRAFLIDQRGERKMIITSIDKKLEKVKKRYLKRKQRSEELREMAAKSNASSSVVSSQELGPECSFSSTSSDATILEDKSKDDFVVPVPKKTKSSSSSCGVEPSTSGIFTQHVTIVTRSPIEKQCD